MFCCLTASNARALLCMADVEFRMQVVVEAVVACPEPEDCHLFPSCQKVVGVSLVVMIVVIMIALKDPFVDSVYNLLTGP